MAIKATHPSVEELTAFVAGQLPESRAGDVERHIDDCDPCSQTLVSLSSEDTFVELLKQAGSVPETSTMGMRQSEFAGEIDVLANLSEHPRYEIAELIARGGMGEVYKAKHRVMDRTVALKVIKSKLMQNVEVVERFHREVKTAAHLSHPNIVTAYDAEQANGVHFLVMEHVEGTNLAELVKRDGPLDVAQACDYARQVAAGLQHAHEQRMIHRDIKPHNLMLTNDGTVKILDFGLAALSSKTIAEHDGDNAADSSLTRAGNVMGTPDFISPEQAVDAHQADIRSDIYGLGATLYYLISGQPPFSTGGVKERLKDHRETKPVPVDRIRDDVPQDVADLIDRMLEKDPADRYQNPQELEAALKTLSVAQPNRSRQTSQAPGRRLPKLLWALVGGTIAALLAGLIYIETDKGTLTIETMDENVKVTIKKVSDSGSDEYTKLEVVDTVTGSRVSRLRSGEYKVSLDENSNQFKLNKDGFTLSRGGKVVVKVISAEAEKVEAPPLAKLQIPLSTLTKLYLEGVKLSQEQVRDLEMKFEKDPSDVISRIKVLGYYSRKSMLNAGAREPHLKQVRWFVQNYPEFYSHSMNIHASVNPEGYVEIKKRWLETVDRYPTNTTVLGNTAKFLLQSDRKLTRELLEKAQALEPQDPKWPMALGQAYRLDLIGNRSKPERKLAAEKACENFELAMELSGDSAYSVRLMINAARSAMAAGHTEKARGYAEQLLKEPGKANEAGGAIHCGNTILGRIALQKDSVVKAKEHLLASGRISSSPVLGSFGPSMSLAKELLEKEETEVVLEYLELCEKFWNRPNALKKLKQWTKDVQEGVVPGFGHNLIY